MAALAPPIGGIWSCFEEETEERTEESDNSPLLILCKTTLEVPRPVLDTPVPEDIDMLNYAQRRSPRWLEAGAHDAPGEGQGWACSACWGMAVRAPTVIYSCLVERNKKEETRPFSVVHSKKQGIQGAFHGKFQLASELEVICCEWGLDENFSWGPFQSTSFCDSKIGYSSVEEQPTYFTLQALMGKAKKGTETTRSEDVFLFDYMSSGTIQLEGPE